jgi:hypothetical protein
MAMGRVSVMADKARAEKGSFFGRMLKRLVFLAVLAAFALVAGFKAQKGRWAWQDSAGFQAYALEWWRFTKEKGIAAASAVKRKADEAGITAKTEELIERARRALSGEPAAEPQVAGQMAPKAATETAQARAEGEKAQPAAGSSETPAFSGGGSVPDGYYQEFKTGYEAYRDGLAHYLKATPRSAAEQKELRAAKASFESARDHWDRAAGIYDRDARLESLRLELNQYLYDCRKRLKPTY